mmetsp:Transcript_6515/g.18190  ORF Transcript_6515/g.18190 Transcript_6515/m.18190 type:complete len:652 (-) Transcript_6515:285-2240(-)
MKGHLIACVIVSAIAAAVAQQAITTAVGTYTPQSNVDTQLGVSQTVSDIVNQLSDGNFAGAQSTYQGDSYLSGLGKGQGLSGSMFDMYKAYFGAADFNNAYLMNEAFTNPVAASKSEMVQKTVWDAIPVQAIMSMIDEGAAGTPSKWDQAAALYFGNRQLESSPYDRASKRADNYGTFAPGGEEAAVNKAIMDAFQSATTANKDKIVKNLMIIYAQASIRYARLLDNDLAESPPLPVDDHRAEGQAFYRIIAPRVASVDSECDSRMTNMYDLDMPMIPGGYYYCWAVDCIPDALGLTTEDIGTLEDTEGACSGSPGTSISTPVGSFIPQNDVTKQLGVSATVKAINDKVADGDFDDVDALYKADPYLMALGKGEGLSGDTFDLFKSYFGRADFNDAYFKQALDMSIVASKSEMIEKTVMDAIPVQAILSYAKQGAAGDREKWDQAAALFLGLRDMESSPYDRANKRAANYGTETNGEANANQAILNALNNPSTSSYNTILENLKIIYAQSAIRYAHILDNDMAEGLPIDDHHAEGQAFYRIIAPFVKQGDADCDDTMSDMYDLNKSLNSNGDYYCNALSCVPSALGLSQSDIGTLEDTEGLCGNAPNDDGQDDDGKGDDSGANAQNSDSSATGMISRSVMIVFTSIAAMLW